jgi:aspartyl-tRNA(Asn)/glutamyl-tRNA(Gln) amidotransferase subunit A
MLQNHKETAAEAWAAQVLPASRAAPIAPAGTPFSREPAHAEAFLAAAARPASAHKPPPSAPPGDPCPMGVEYLLTAYRNGTTDPPSILADLLARSLPDGKAPEAVLSRVPGAEAAAEASAQRYRAGTARPLEGVFFGVKDIIDVSGARVTCGSWQTGDRIADADATCVARLRDAGAIPLFMLATSEYACGAAHNARYGPVPNPWDRTRWAGGSSTGAGAALAAGIVPLALGSDTGGSIRIPAAFCGITGLKPTRGLVPRTGVATLSWTLDHIGPMARSAADIALTLPHLAGPDGEDSLAAPAVPDFSAPQGVAGLRIGVPDGWFTERCDAAVLHAWREALGVLANAGALLVPVTTPDLALAHEEAWMVLYAELASVQESRLATPDRFDTGTRDRIARGLQVAATDYLRALRRRPLLQQAVLHAMAGTDVLITPGTGAEAARLSDLTVQVDGAHVPMYEITPRNTMIFDYTGFPALMLPAGLGASGLPVAIQIAARPFADATCLSVGAAFQSLTSHHLRQP